MITRVVNIKNEPYDVYIGRPSKWGNPFRIIHPYNRADIIHMYSTWVKEQPELMAALHELKGKRLGCYCKPADCHGDILAKLAEALP